jgi:two-component system, OmpR family, phosphate regulon sensor histidine kinase PhoR
MKPRILFFVLAFYILAAFTWLTYSSIVNSRIRYENERELLFLRGYSVNSDIQEKMVLKEIYDTTSFKEYMRLHHPDYEVNYVEGSETLSEFALYPKKEAEDALKEKLERRELMYLSEGIVFVLLLLWGLVWIYRSFEQRMSLNLQQHNFLLSVTHELKTPLASVKLYLQTLGKRSLDAEQTSQIIHNSLQETDRLNDLIEKVLVAAQIEGKSYHYNPERLNLSLLLNEICDKFSSARAGKATLSRQIQDDVFIQADRFTLSLAISNLVENAFKYSNKEQSVIRVKLSLELGEPVLQVQDNGIGMAPHELKRIFKKFYRVGNESTRQSKGTGLGLYIVKQVLDNHRARINVESKTGQGTLFTIKFNSDGE